MSTPSKRRRKKPLKGRISSVVAQIVASRRSRKAAKRARRARHPLHDQLSTILAAMPPDESLADDSAERRRSAALQLVHALLTAFKLAKLEPQPPQSIALAAAIESISRNNFLAAIRHARSILVTRVRAYRQRKAGKRRQRIARLRTLMARLRKLGDVDPGGAAPA